MVLLPTRVTDKNDRHSYLSLATPDSENRTTARQSRLRGVGTGVLQFGRGVSVFKLFGLGQDSLSLRSRRSKPSLPQLCLLRYEGYSRARMPRALDLACQWF